MISVTWQNASGTYTSGDVLAIDVKTQAVMVTSHLQYCAWILAMRAIAGRDAIYFSGNNTAVLVFKWSKATHLRRLTTWIQDQLRMMLHTLAHTSALQTDIIIEILAD